MLLLTVKEFSFSVLLKNKFLLAAVAIMLLATGIRLYKLGDVPVSLYWDEVAILLDAKVLAATAKDMHGRVWYQVMYPSYGDFKLPVYIWFSAIAVKILGVSSFAVRITSAIAGILTVLLAGGIANEITRQDKSARYRQIVTLTTMLVVAINPWPVMFSRTGFEGHLGQFLLGLSVWLLLKTKHKPWLSILAALIGGLATYTYFSVRFVWPVVFFLVTILHTYQLPIPKSIKLKRSVGWSIIAAIIFGITLIPMTKSPLYADSNRFRLSTSSVLNDTDYPIYSNQLKLMAGNEFIDRAFYHRHLLMVQALLKNVSSNLSLSFLFVSGDPNLRHGTGEHGLFLFPFLPFLLIGFSELAKRKPRILLLLIGWWLIGILPASVPNDTPHALRSLNALLPISLILGFGLSWVFTKEGLTKFVSHRPSTLQPSKLLKILQAIIISTIFISSFSFLHHYFTYYPQDSAFDWQDGYTQLATELAKQSPGVSEIWVTPFEDRLYLWLLAYGPYTGAQIQAMPTDDYKVKTIDNIKFAGFAWFNMGRLGGRTLIVDRVENLEYKIDNEPVKPLITTPIYGYDGEAKYLIAEYGPKL
jgi:4-amino-4-deoxy-L-arabinose transferase-like glycosyltransferase